MLKRLLRRLGRPGEPQEPLRGRPRIRREKSYAADSGYVYQYTFEGYRHAARDGAAGRDFVFLCSSDRSARVSVAVFAPDDSFAEWERGSGRELTEVERYAVVKMRLFEVFDESAHLRADLVDTLTAAQVERQVEALDL